MIDPAFKPMLAAAILIYLAIMYWIAIAAARRVQNVEDYLVAGRRLPLSLAWMTILATWFGAGTLLAVADEVRASGVQAAALDPLGAGVCLLFVGFFVAAPMWREKLTTVPEFFGRRFGRTAELLAVAILVPSYFGWIAAQFVAIANMLELFFDIDPQVGLLLAAMVGGGYTLLGGMWSVTMTDALQISLVLVGLLVLLGNVLVSLGSGDMLLGISRIALETPPTRLQLVPTEHLTAFVAWLGVFVTGALGNVPVQDLMQRVFASRCERTAQRACLLAGAVYLVFGAIPVLLALAANLLFPDAANASILPLLAQTCLSPGLAIVFIVCLLSAVLSTIDSALLSPSAVLAQNVFLRYWGTNGLFWNRASVVLVTACSLGVAWQGANAYALLEQAYELTLVGLFVPLMMGLYRSRPHAAAAVSCMAAGTLAWLLHVVMGWEMFLEPVAWAAAWQCPVSLACAILCLGVYCVVERLPHSA